MQISEDTLEKVNNEIELLIGNYQETAVSCLLEKMNISAKSKSCLNALTKRLIAYTNLITLSQLDETNYFKIKTVKLDKYGKLKESMSFPAFRYTDIAEEEWENSEFRKYFKKNIVAFTVYQGIGKELYLNKIVLWKMPEEVLEVGVRMVWEKTKECILTGGIVKYIDNNGRYFSFFPSSTENPYMHVRPHARDREDTNLLPVADKLTGLVQYPKHCFWLNRSYVLKIISREGR